MRITATKLRENIYSILDQVAETGEPVEIERKGKILLLVHEKKPSKLDRIKKRDWAVGDLDSIIYMDWSKEWSELKRK